MKAIPGNGSPESVPTRAGERDIQEFYDESPDRALAISLPAILDNRLTSILKAIMRPERDVIVDLFRSGGALGSFGARIRMAYALGVIDRDVYRDLTAISKVRNDFAHKVLVKTFDDESITGRIKSMHVYSVLISLRDSMPYEPEQWNAGEKPSFDMALSYILNEQLSTMRDSFRECIRLMIHHLNELEQAILATGERPWVRSGPPSEQPQEER